MSGKHSALLRVELRDGLIRFSEGIRDMPALTSERPKVFYTDWNLAMLEGYIDQLQVAKDLVRLRDDIESKKRQRRGILIDLCRYWNEEMKVGKYTPADVALLTPRDRMYGYTPDYDLQTFTVVGTNYSVEGYGVRVILELEGTSGSRWDWKPLVGAILWDDQLERDNMYDYASHEGDLTKIHTAHTFGRKFSLHTTPTNAFGEALGHFLAVTTPKIKSEDMLGMEFREFDATKASELFREVSRRDEELRTMHKNVASLRETVIKIKDVVAAVIKTYGVDLDLSELREIYKDLEDKLKEDKEKANNGGDKLHGW